MFVRKRMMVYDAKDASGESFEIWHGLAPEETSMPLATTSRIPTLHVHRYPYMNTSSTSSSSSSRTLSRLPLNSRLGRDARMRLYKQ